MSGDNVIINLLVDALLVQARVHHAMMQGQGP